MRLFSLVLFLLSPILGSKMTGTLDAPVATLQGIDVSHHQEKIDWEAVVKKNDLQFAFVKATEGSDFEDSLFYANWEQLQKIGIRRGAYHYFRPYGCGFEQALHFMDKVKLAPGDLAPVLDLETTDGMPPEIMLEEVRIWLQTVERSLNVRPILYTNQDFYEKYLVGVFDSHPLWIARYSDQEPALKGGSMWHFWQYTNEGCLEGIPQNVDLNIFRGTPEMLDRLCWFPAEGLPMPLDVTAAP